MTPIRAMSVLHAGRFAATRDLQSAMGGAIVDEGGDPTGVCQNQRTSAQGVAEASTRAGPAVRHVPARAPAGRHGRCFWAIAP